MNSICIHILYMLDQWSKYITVLAYFNIIHTIIYCLFLLCIWCQNEYKAICNIPSTSLIAKEKKGTMVKLTTDICVNKKGISPAAYRPSIIVWESSIRQTNQALWDGLYACAAFICAAHTHFSHIHQFSQSTVGQAVQLIHAIYSLKERLYT